MLRSKADEARAGDASELESIRSSQWHPAAITYREALEQLLDHRLARSLTVNRANMGFWLVRDELIASKMNACTSPANHAPVQFSHPRPQAPEVTTKLLMCKTSS